MEVFGAFWALARRCKSAENGATVRAESARPVGANRRKSAQTGANRRKSAQNGATVRAESAQIGANRRKSAQIGANRRKSAQTVFAKKAQFLAATRRKTAQAEPRACGGHHMAKPTSGLKRANSATHPVL